jgi:hypothetical protein
VSAWKSFVLNIRNSLSSSAKYSKLATEGEEVDEEETEEESSEEESGGEEE